MAASASAPVVLGALTLNTAATTCPGAADEAEVEGVGEGEGVAPGEREPEALKLRVGELVEDTRLDIEELG